MTPAELKDALQTGSEIEITVTGRRSGRDISIRFGSFSSAEGCTSSFEAFRAKYGADVDRYYPKRDVAVEVPLA